MIVLSQHNRDILAGPNAFAILMVCILKNDDSLLYASTTHYQDLLNVPANVVFPGVDVKNEFGETVTFIPYLADGTLVSLAPPTLSTSVDREQYSMMMTDQTLLSYAANTWGMIGLRFRVTAVFSDGTTPSFTSENMLTVYAGRISGVTHNQSMGTAGESLIKITAGSPMYGLDQKNGIFFSDPKIKERNKKDTCAEHVYVTSRNYALHWGK
jgi:hypothetical protein